MSKHTPGPWKYGPPFIVAPALRACDDCTEVCEVLDSGGDGDDVFEPFREGDARLISAAPDLYEACKEAIVRLTDLFNRHERPTYYKDSSADSDLELILRTAKLAIAKAEDRA